ncbi:MAG: SDR family oxidoreductase [Chloroflexi bacterium]|nr:SDR family oxidoreductase [Chloroflexota bacterium]MCI0577059.1 SDR family oxidoreductase [Chloroflexota bacterium]MCI0643529.1 SDR family oxidoreductase [Chloroflexota bacterium]MCI0728139.1 SDR family oxidoreductase [Chloroflexota bacterium]
MKKLTGKVALVTGASRRVGIGAAIAQSLAAAGADVFITYYRPYDTLMPWGSRPDEVDDLLLRLQGYGVRAAGLEADLADPTVPARLFEHVEQTFGWVDILVNNATHDEEVGLEDSTAEMLDRHYAVNVRGALLLCREFVRRYHGRPGGRIVNLTSGQGLSPMPGNLPYAATKGAIDAATFSLAPALAAKGITINAVDPGPTDTGWMSQELRQELEQRAPFGRIGLPEDAAQLVCFLASDEAGWITGQIIRSRGGF